MGAGIVAQFPCIYGQPQVHLTLNLAVEFKKKTESNGPDLYRKPASLCMRP